MLTYCITGAAIADVSVLNKTRKLNYPPAFSNLRLFSTPLDHKLFFAGVFLSPIIPSENSTFYSQVGNNGFACPHPKLPDNDTKFKHFSKEQVFQNDYFPQNVKLGPEIPFNEKPVSPPRMDPTFEEICPLFRPLSEHTEDSTDEMGSLKDQQTSNQSPERT